MAGGGAREYERAIDTSSGVSPVLALARAVVSAPRLSTYDASDRRKLVRLAVAAPPPVVADPTPMLDVVPSVVVFTLVVGAGVQTQLRTASVANTEPGGFPIPPLLSEITYLGFATGWITALVLRPEQDGTYALDLTVSSSGMAASVQSATVDVVSPGAIGSPFTVTVLATFVGAALPVMAVSPSSLALTVLSGAVHIAQRVLIAPATANALVAPTLGTITYDVNASGYLAAVILDNGDGTFDLSITPSGAGQPTGGPYAALIPVFSATATNSPLLYPVTVTVILASPPIIQLARSTMDFRGVNGEAQSTPASDTIAIVNAGGSGPLTGLSVVSNQAWSPAVIAGLAVQASPTPLTLPPGTAYAVLTISAVGAVDVQASVVLNVAGAVASPSITLTPAAPTQFTATVNTANPTPQDLVLTNSGGGTLDAAVVTILSGAPWLTAVVTGSGNSQFVRVQPVTGALAVGTYAGQCSVVVANAINTPILFNVSFVVIPLQTGAEPTPWAVIPTWATHVPADGSLMGQPFIPEALTYFS